MLQNDLPNFKMTKGNQKHLKDICMFKSIFCTDRKFYK